MGAERYLNHPTFGMLYQLSTAGEGRDLYATLYAQRMYFLVTLQPRGAQFEVIPYQDARHHAELHLARCRHLIKHSKGGVIEITLRSHNSVHQDLESTVLASQSHYREKHHK